MLKCATSLWSADLTNLAADVRRVEPFSETFHLDVADGHYTPTMLFFPDLVSALRKHTRLPLEVHLMTTDPLAWLDPFIDAGVDGIIICHDSVSDPAAVLRAIRNRGKRAGMSLLITEPLDVVEPCWEDLDLLVLLGTAVGIKGASLDPGAPDKIAQARRIIRDRGYQTEIEADGGIRRETVPLLAAAGADWIVPGSLMFKEEPAAMRAWLRTLTP